MEEVDRAYKKKNACAQRLTMIYQNQAFEQEMAQNEIEKQVIDDFYEEYKNKYFRKLEGWQEIIDLYSEQETQKIEEEKQYKEQEYKQQKEREKQKAVRKTRIPEVVPPASGETRLKGVCDNVLVETSKTSVTLPVITGGKGAQTQTVSSTGITCTHTVRDNQVVDSSGDMI